MFNMKVIPIDALLMFNRKVIPIDALLIVVEQIHSKCGIVQIIIMSAVQSLTRRSLRDNVIYSNERLKI